MELREASKEAYQRELLVRKLLIVKKESKTEEMTR
jgi:hypothetical protein